jgi:hypothetical protein
MVLWKTVVSPNASTNAVHCVSFSIEVWILGEVMLTYGVVAVICSFSPAKYWLLGTLAIHMTETQDETQADKALNNHCSPGM